MNAVLIGFDGTLADSEPVHLRSWQRVLPRYGIAVVPEIFGFRFVGVPAPTEAATIIAENRLNVTPDALVAEKEVAFRDIVAAEGIPLMPGASEALARLKRAGLALGLVTGSPRFIVDAALAQHRLAGEFRVIVAIEDVRHSKPDPECYLQCMARMAVAPDQCVAVEDSTNGVAAAKNAGLLCVAVRNGWTTAQDLSRADAQAADLMEAAEWILHGCVAKTEAARG